MDNLKEELTKIVHQHGNWQSTKDTQPSKIVSDAIALFESYVKACKPEKFLPTELPYDEHTYEHGFNNGVDDMTSNLLKELKG